MRRRPVLSGDRAESPDPETDNEKGCDEGLADMGREENQWQSLPEIIQVIKDLHNYFHKASVVR
jgi:hypothetical protein